MRHSLSVGLLGKPRSVKASARLSDHEFVGVEKGRARKRLEQRSHRKRWWQCQDSLEWAMSVLLKFELQQTRFVKRR